MKIGIDIRSLMSPIRTGVGEYAHGLLTALFSMEMPHEYVLWYNSAKDVRAVVPEWNAPRVSSTPTRYPNKLLDAAIFAFGRPRLDRMVGERGEHPVDCWFSPNLHFTRLSETVKHILTIHDLSFEHFPECFSLKQRLWHRSVRPREQCARARLIITPSAHTRDDLTDTYSIAPEKVVVLSPGVHTRFPTNEDRERARRRYALPEKYILFLGTIEPRKNVSSILEAYRHLPERVRAEYALVIAGPQGWKEGELERSDEARVLGSPRRLC